MTFLALTIYHLLIIIITIIDFIRLGSHLDKINKYKKFQKTFYYLGTFLFIIIIIIERCLFIF